MIHSISFRNFKSWRQFDLTFSNLNVFFGENSSGKSSIIQLILLLKQTIENRDDSIILDFGNEKSLTNLGSFDDILFKGVKNKDEVLDVNFSFSGTTNRYTSTANIGRDQNNILELKEIKIDGSNNQQIHLRKNTTHRNHIEAKYFSLHENIKSFYDLGLNPTGVVEIDNLAQNYRIDIQKLFDNIIYIGPLRDYPKRGYTWTSTRPSDFGVKGERTFDAIITSTKEEKMYFSKRLMIKATLPVIISKWLEYFGLADAFELKPVSGKKNDFQVMIKTRGANSWVDISDVGFGVSQILPIIGLCYYVQENSVLIIEQPEIHLHPSVQSGLGDLFIDVMQSRNVQIIIESHSEHLLTRIQRRIAEENLSSELVKVNFISLNDGESKLEPLRMNEYGEIENWPKHFFGDQMTEVYHMQKNILERKMSKLNN